MKIELKLLDDRLRDPEYAPGYATPRSAAIDLRACTVHDPLCGPLRMGKDPGEYAAYIIPPGERVKFGAGLAVHLGSMMLDDGDPVSLDDDSLMFAGLVLPRSGIGSKHGIVLSNLVGLIDPDYQGEIGITLWNAGPQDFVVEPMARLCQMVIVPTLQVSFVTVDEFSSGTERGANGFGSSGVR